MKTIRLQQHIGVGGLTQVQISNTLTTLRLNQSSDDQVHITADFVFTRDIQPTEELRAEDFFRIRTDEGKLNIELEDTVLDETDAELSHQSVVSMSIPQDVKVIAECDNYSISALNMQNDFQLSNENGSLRLENCMGSIVLSNENGGIKLNGNQGRLEIKQENGGISGERNLGDILRITSENGAVKLRDCTYTDAYISNENGGVYYQSGLVDSGTLKLENENGHVHLALTPEQGYRLHAETDMGMIRNDWMGGNISVQGEHDATFGDEGLVVELKTENGLIKITNADQFSAEYLRSKFEQIHAQVKQGSEESLHEAEKLIANLSTYLQNKLDKVNDPRFQEKLRQGLDYLQKWQTKLNDPELKAKVKDTLSSISQDIQRSMAEAMQTARESIRREMRFHFGRERGRGRQNDWDDAEADAPEAPEPPEPPHMQHRKGGGRRFGFDPMEMLERMEKKGFIHGMRADNMKAEMEAKSRMKILEMLETGKITAEEAERLLRAIGKE